MFLLLSKRRICSGIPRFFSSSTTQNADPKTPDFVAADYLVASFGFSPDRAATVSKSIAHLKSPEKPDSVRRFLEEQGFSEADIKKLIIGRPNLLCSCPEKTLHPNLRTLRDIGLSISALNKIIISNPTALLRDSAVSRITFWMDFLGGHEPALVKTFMHNRSLINYDITQAIAPKISLLQSQGFSNLEIRRIVSTVPRFITSTTSGMEDSLNRAKELGFQPGSGMFFKALQAMVCVTRDVLRKRMGLFKSFGWSEDDFFSAVRNAPLMVTFKEENLRPKMDFLLGGARCAPLYVASHSMLLTYSLEKRLRPRHHVLHLLETKGLCHKHKVLYSAICMCNNDFVAKYVLPHKELVPELHEAYADLCASGS